MPPFPRAVVWPKPSLRPGAQRLHRKGSRLFWFPVPGLPEGMGFETFDLLTREETKPAPRGKLHGVDPLHAERALSAAVDADSAIVTDLKKGETFEVSFEPAFDPNVYTAAVFVESGPHLIVFGLSQDSGAVRLVVVDTDARKVVSDEESSESADAVYVQSCGPDRWVLQLSTDQGPSRFHRVDFDIASARASLEPEPLLVRTEPAVVKFSPTFEWALRFADERVVKLALPGGEPSGEGADIGIAVPEEGLDSDVDCLFLDPGRALLYFPGTKELSLLHLDEMRLEDFELGGRRDLRTIDLLSNGDILFDVSTEEKLRFELYPPDGFGTTG